MEINWEEIDLMLVKYNIRNSDKSKEMEKTWFSGREQFTISIKDNKVTATSIKRYGGLLVKNRRWIRDSDDIFGIYNMCRDFPWLLKLKIV